MLPLRPLGGEGRGEVGVRRPCLPLLPIALRWAPPSPPIGRRGNMNLLNLARSLAEAPRALTVYGAPEGHDAAAIGALVETTWLHVCRDDNRMQRFADALGFFHPKLRVLTFPAWDCLP